MQELKLSCFEEVNSGCNLSREDMSNVTQESVKVNSSAAHIARPSEEASPVLIRCNAKVVDVNKIAGVKFNPPTSSVESAMGTDRALLSKKELGVPNVSRKEVGVVTEKDVPYSSNSYPFYPCKKASQEQSVKISESGSVTHLPKQDPLEVWKEMKQNGFLSSSHSQKLVTVPPMKSRVRKTKADITKKKIEQLRIEQAKKEQTERFTKIAAPSGLLNELNPGIINHVRNSKQVHSILKALVRPAENDARTNSIKELDKINNTGIGQHALRENGLSNCSAHCRMTIGDSSFMEDSQNIMRVKDVGLEGHADTEISNQSLFIFPDCKKEIFKFPSTRKARESTSTISNEGNQNSVSSLSVKAASVASQWLELLQQDIKGRLAALIRSKKRVHAVLQTELPLLLSNEFPSNQENEQYVVKSPTPDPQSSTAWLHEIRWKSLFGNMDTTLTEEEQQLKSMLEQVQDMRLVCERGLYCEQHSVPAYLESLQGSEGDLLRSKMGNSDTDLAVRAAAAATCNFLMENENIGCSQTR